MAALFRRVVRLVLIYVLIRFRKGRQPRADHAGVRSGISTHLEFSVVLIEAGTAAGLRDPAMGKTR